MNSRQVQSFSFSSFFLFLFLCSGFNHFFICPNLQLLMCGLSTVSFSDLKQNARVSGSDVIFKKVVSWFWSMISGFTQEEMAKLLQFVTGCSQLPPGGFKELRPPFTITHAPTHSRLPTAHTWSVCACLDLCLLFKYMQAHMLTHAHVHMHTHTHTHTTHTHTHTHTHNYFLSPFPLQ